MLLWEAHSWGTKNSREVEEDGWGSVWRGAELKWEDFFEGMVGMLLIREHWRVQNTWGPDRCCGHSHRVRDRGSVKNWCALLIAAEQRHERRRVGGWKWCDFLIRFWKQSNSDVFLPSFVNYNFFFPQQFVSSVWAWACNFLGSSFSQH